MRKAIMILLLIVAACLAAIVIMVQSFFGKVEAEKNRMKTAPARAARWLEKPEVSDTVVNPDGNIVPPTNTEDNGETEKN
jgi:hypothetical protein